MDGGLSHIGVYDFFMHFTCFQHVFLTPLLPILGPGQVRPKKPFLRVFALVTQAAHYRYAGVIMKTNENQLIMPFVGIPKIEAMEQVNKRILDLRVQLELSKIQMKTIANPSMGSLNFEIHDLQKRLHALMLQVEQMKRGEKPEVTWDGRCSA